MRLSLQRGRPRIRLVNVSGSDDIVEPVCFCGFADFVAYSPKYENIFVFEYRYQVAGKGYEIAQADLPQGPED